MSLESQRQLTNSASLQFWIKVHAAWHVLFFVDKVCTLVKSLHSVYFLKKLPKMSYKESIGYEKFVLNLKKKKIPKKTHVSWERLIVFLNEKNKDLPLPPKAERDDKDWCFGKFNSDTVVHKCCTDNWPEKVWENGKRTSVMKFVFINVADCCVATLLKRAAT